MFDLIKVDEHKFFSDTINRGIDYVKSMDYSRQEYAMGDLTMAGDGSIVTPDGVFGMTEYAMKTLLKTLKVKVPRSYAWNIDTDHLVYDVNTLLNDDARGAILAIKDDVVYGVHRNEFSPIPNIMLVDSLLASNWAIESMHVAPHIMRLIVSGHNSYDVGNDDVSKVSIEIINSDIGWTHFSTHYLMYRCVCSNCAIVKDNSYTRKYTQHNKAPETVLQSFFMINNRDWMIDKFENALNHMRKTPNKELRLIRNQSSLLEDSSDFDGLNGVFHLLKSCVGKSDAEMILGQCDDDTFQYETYNDITSAAHQYDTTIARRIELLGGVMFTHALSEVRKAA